MLGEIAPRARTPINVLSDTYANLPAAGVVGRVFLPTDGFAIGRDTGSAWAWWMGGTPVTPPPSSGWSWVNQGGATITQTGSGLTLTAPAASAEAFRVRVRSVIASSGYTATIGFIPLLVFANYTKCGFYITDGTKCILFAYESDNANATAGPYYVIAKYSTQTGTFVSSTFSTAWAWGLMRGPLVWLRLVDDGTNRKYQVSADGTTWVTFVSVARTDFLTPTQYGFFACSDNANVQPSSLNVLHWSETTP